MSNIDKRALREKTEAALAVGDGMWVGWMEAFQRHPEIFTSGGHIVATVHGAYSGERYKFIAAANPATVLALLDELEAAEKRIAELERKEQHSERQSVIDALAGSGEAWIDIEEYMQKWDAEHAAAAGKGD